MRRHHGRRHQFHGQLASRGARLMVKSGKRIGADALDFALGHTDARAFVRSVLPTAPETALARAFAAALRREA